MKEVYSPCVEPLEYSFDGKPKVLPPKAVTALQDGEARLVVDVYGEYGVCLYSRGVGDELKQAADTVWQFGNRRWAEQVILDWRETTKEKREAGIPVEETEIVKTAKKFLKIATMLLALLCWIAPVQAAEPEVRSANFTYKYDVASASATYCKATGLNGDPYGTPIPVQGRIDTTGSSTTVDEVTTGDNPFELVEVGDVLIVDKGTLGVDSVVVTARASAAQVTVHTAVDWSLGYSFRYYDVACGTGLTNGWIPVTAWEVVQLGVQYDAGDLDTLDVAFFCKGGALGSSDIRVYPGPSSDCGDGTLSGTVCQFTTPGQGLMYKIPHNAFTQCRVALKYGSTDGATREEVTTTVDIARY